jgi:hypothetical protein
MQIQQWSWVIVPITMFVLFLLSQLAKRDEEKKRQARLSPQRRDVPAPAEDDQRTEMQRFLDEVRGMRDRAEQKKQEAQAPWSPPPERIERVVPVVREVRRVEPKPKPQRRRSVTPPQEPAVLEVVALTENADDATVPRRQARAATIRNAAAPAIAEMFTLLRTPRSLATAWILKELLDRPMCMRLGRGGAGATGWV